MNKLLFLLLLNGCTPTIIDRDFEKEEAAYIKEYGIATKDPLYAPQTSNYIFAGNKDNVFVSMYKDIPDNYKGIKLQKWKATIVNHNDYPICAVIHWKLMDFELVSEYPDFIYLAPQQQVYKFAEMKQQIWNIDGTEFSLPPSGYIEDIILKHPTKNSKLGSECSFEDTNIDEI